MSAILVKIPPAIRRAHAAQRFADGKPEEAVPDDIARNKEQDDNHHDQFE